MKKIILLSLLAIIGTLGIAQLVYADTATLSVYPSSLDSAVGTPFNVSVQLNPASSKVCVIKGTLNFNNLSCQNITVASGFMTQVAPTCASPSFTLGIPQCTTTAQNIFSVSAKGIQAGQASLSVTGAKVIGAGSDVAFSLQNGAYNITAVQISAPAPTPTPAPTPAPKTTTAPKTAPKTNTAEPTQPTTTTPAQEPTPPQAAVEEPPAVGQQASLASVSSTKNTVLIIVVVLAVIILGGLWYMYSKKKNKPV